MSKKQKHKTNINMGITIKRLLKNLFSEFPVLLPFIVVAIIISAIITAIPSVFQQRVLAIAIRYLEEGNRNWTLALQEVLPLFGILIGLYLLSLILMTFQTQIMARVTQGFLHRLRTKTFNHMQDLPLSYFDSNKHGDIMSHYTNDIDAIREMIAQSFPNIIRSIFIVLTVLSVMLYFSFIMTVFIIVGIFFMTLVSRKIASGSAKYFMAQQKSIGQVEGFVQEMMNGQKVIKVFNHEDTVVKDFDLINEKLFNDSFKAHAFANSLGPVIMNIGNILYVLTATFGGIYLVAGLPNYGFSGMAFSLSILIPFLNMTKQFTGNLNQISQQANSIVMALAGAQRVFAMWDLQAEVDQGDIKLTNACFDKDGNILPCEDFSGNWAWQKKDQNGQEQYLALTGDMRMEDVNFAYVEGKTVLHDISVYAEPGQKVAFVGSTGAGKTTITNLLNRFYDIQEGKILFDGINVKDIKKKDLRRSLGIVLQETNLFTGSVYDNIRYGKLQATDQECEAGARLVGADDFIRRLPQGYHTELTNNGSNLSQGQRQLIAIARSAIADPPVLILDEATSSIDTRTESIVQKGMDMLMQGRTVFVIAHRLSTIINSDVIMVMEQGRIVERGNHQDLINQKGIYYQLYTGAFELE